MANDKPISVTLELVYVPDTYTETERQEGASWPLGSGFYDLVAVADDARLPLHRYKAGAVDKVFALAKQRKDEQAQQAETTPQAQQQQPPQPAPPEQPPLQPSTFTPDEPAAQPPPGESQQPQAGEPASPSTTPQA